MKPTLLKIHGEMTRNELQEYMNHHGKRLNQTHGLKLSGQKLSILSGTVFSEGAAAYSYAEEHASEGKILCVRYWEGADILWIISFIP